MRWSLLALPPHLLEAVLALVPEDGDGPGNEDETPVFEFEDTGFKLQTTSRLAVEAACRPLRRAALALPPARLWLRFDEEHADIDVQSLLRALQRRPPALQLEVEDLPAGIAPAAWEQLAAPLLSGARTLLVRGGAVDLMLEGACRAMLLESLTVWGSDSAAASSLHGPVPSATMLRCAGWRMA